MRRNVIARGAIRLRITKRVLVFRGRLTPLEPHLTIKNSYSKLTFTISLQPEDDRKIIPTTIDTDMSTEVNETAPTSKAPSLADGRNRWQLGPLQHPVRGLMDATAALVAVGAGIWLTLHFQVPWTRRLALGVYGLSLVGLFTVSSMYHMVPWAAKAKARMQRLDHTMIFMLIAGTYTPVISVIFDGWVRATFLIVIWGIALLGTIQKWLLPKIGHWFSVAAQSTHGWLAVFLIVPLFQRLPLVAMVLAITGGLLYTVGMIFLTTRRPRLWPRVFSYHEAFHVFVIAAGVAHFVMIARFIAPYGTSLGA